MESSAQSDRCAAGRTLSFGSKESTGAALRLGVRPHLHPRGKRASPQLFGIGMVDESPSRMKTPDRRGLVLTMALSFAAAACTPAVGIGPKAARPARSVMVVAGDTVRGAAGDRIELAAWGFTGAGARVWFGATPAARTRVVDGWRLEVVVPPGSGLVDVCVENGAGAWVLLEAFRYPEGAAVERCWPESVPPSRVDEGARRILDARQAASGARLAAGPR